MDYMDYFDMFNADEFGDESDVQRDSCEDRHGVCCICHKNAIVSHVIFDSIDDDVCDDCISKMIFIV